MADIRLNQHQIAAIKTQLTRMGGSQEVLLQGADPADVLTVTITKETGQVAEAVVIETSGRVRTPVFP